VLDIRSSVIELSPPNHHHHETRGRRIAAPIGLRDTDTCVWNLCAWVRYLNKAEYHTEDYERQASSGSHQTPVMNQLRSRLVHPTSCCVQQIVASVRTLAPQSILCFRAPRTHFSTLQEKSWLPTICQAEFEQTNWGTHIHDGTRLQRFGGQREGAKWEILLFKPCTVGL
jgi:hypothetical protein